MLLEAVTQKQHHRMWNFWEGSALMYASRCGRVDMVKLVLDKANYLAEKAAFTIHALKDALREAITGGHLEVANLLIRRGANVKGGTKAGTPLHVACYFGEIESAELLLDRGANPNMSHRAKCSTLLLASSTGNDDLCQLLLAHGADSFEAATPSPWYSQRTPFGTSLHAACYYGHMSIIELLLQDKPDLDSGGHLCYSH